ncbi:MAG TPA: NYN domain-containing protein [Coriobacteriia bacterium]
MARHLIIDGYNLLRGSRRYAAEAQRDLEAACARLIADLGARAADGQKVTVVFDGGGNRFSHGTPRIVGGLTVIYSAAGTDADSVIEAMAAAAREAGEDTEIVTSDAATRWSSLGGPVIVTRASSFALELDDDETEWRAQADVQAAARGTVSDRLGDGVRARLDRLAGRRAPER